MINKVGRGKSTAKAKLKAASQEERVHLWKQYFENLLRKPLKVTHGPIRKSINNQLDIKLELDVKKDKEKLKIGKQQGLMKYP